MRAAGAGRRSSNGERVTTELLHQTARTLSSGLAATRDLPAEDEAVYAWVVDHLGVRIPRRACCPDRRAPFEAVGS